MRRLQKTKPSGRGLGIALPLTQGHYYPMAGNMYWHRDDFLGAALDTDEWSTTISGTATITVTSGLATITGSTGGTAGVTYSAKFNTLESGAQNMFYTVPFRVDFLARLQTLNSAINSYFRVRDTGGTHLADFQFIASSLTSTTIVNARTRAGSTAAGYINSAALAFFATAGLSVSAYNHYVIEMNHRGVWFGLNPEADSSEPPKMLKFFGTNLPRHDLNYVIEVKQDYASADAAVDAAQIIDVDSITVEQLAPMVPTERNGESPRDISSQTRSLLLFQAMVSNAASLATTGAGVFLGFSYADSAVNSVISDCIAAYDSSSGVASFVGGDTATSRLIWLQNTVAQATASGGQAVAFGGRHFPAAGIPFYRGLQIGTTGLLSSAGGGSTSISICPIWRTQV